MLQPIKSTTQIWVATRRQYGISELVPHTSFPGEAIQWSRNEMLAVFSGHISSQYQTPLLRVIFLTLFSVIDLKVITHYVTCLIYYVH